MNGFGLLVGHLLGDYVFQNDWQAANKTKSSMACAVHCFLYTLAVWLCACWWLPWWGVATCWLAHFPVDRFGLARRWMIHVSGQEKFATGALAPWSVIVVDNTFHLSVLFVIGLVTN